MKFKVLVEKMSKVSSKHPGYYYCNIHFGIIPY